MNIDRFKDQHHEILQAISQLRRCAHAGVAEHAEQIARLVVSMSAVIKLHLAAEDHTLYPALVAGQDAELARMGQRFQDEMASIAIAYHEFARRWNTAAHVRADPEGFRADANQVLRMVHERMRREDRDFYPAIETAGAPTARSFGATATC